MKTESIAKCKNCGSQFIGKPWNVRICTICETWMAPDYFHPDAPKAVQVEGKIKMAAIARSLTGVAAC
jgi:hypothetical protein